MAGEARETVEIDRALKLEYRIRELPRGTLPSELHRALRYDQPLARVRFPASIDRGARKLAVQLQQQRIELPLPEWALSWLEEREVEAAPLKPAAWARVQRSGGRLDVLLVLSVEKPKPARPDPRQALLVYVRAAEYGLASVLASCEGGRTKIRDAMKHVHRLAQRRLMSGALRGGPVPRGRGWTADRVAEIFALARRLAGGKPVLANIDAEGGYFRRPLARVRGLVENYANWYGIYAEYKSHPSGACPLCGRALKVVGVLRDRVSRAVQCECGFREDREYVPFHHWVRGLGLPPPEHPIRQLRLAQRGEP